MLHHNWPVAVLRAYDMDMGWNICQSCERQRSCEWETTMEEIGSFIQVLAWCKCNEPCGGKLLRRNQSHDWTGYCMLKSMSYDAGLENPATVPSK